ncbi:MAG TPA: tetratricopeptide repeat protein [Thermoanaerobaculia bacterium]|nr:tetratricopeptide repeat protein [Thermoanaerobaculia bacterium]
MNGNDLDRPKRFKIFQGDGPRSAVEAERLDRFLTGADPLVVASPPEGRLLPRRRLVWGFALLLGLATVLPFLWRPTLLGKLSGMPQAFQNREQARLLVAQGQDLLGEDRDGEALARFQLAVQVAPRYADAWTSLATAQMRGFQSTLAERTFQRALALDPDNKRALHGLGNLYLRQGNQRKAEEIWRRGGQDQQLARLYLLQGKFHDAQIRLAPLLETGGKDEIVGRMALAARTGRLEPSLRSLLEPDPAGRSSWAELGWSLAQQKRYGNASVAFGRALDEIPSDVNALSGMGTSLLALDRPGEAQIYFERALRLREDHMRSLNGLAWSLKAQGQTGAAIAVWQETSRRYPGVGINTAIPGLAWTYFEKRDYRQAAVYFAQIVKDHPYDARVVEALNVAVQNIGSVGAVGTAVSTAVGTGPN